MRSLECLAEFAQLDFLLDHMQRFVEDRVEDSGYGEDAADNRAHIGGQMAEGAKQ